MWKCGQKSYRTMGNLAEINVMVWSQTYNSEILADFNLAERYSTVIRTLCMYTRNKSAKLNSPPIFPGRSISLY